LEDSGGGGGGGRQRGFDGSLNKSVLISLFALFPYKKRFCSNLSKAAQQTFSVTCIASEMPSGLSFKVRQPS
jgi:hypothetical protein